jgi:DNA gyrase subunit B
MRQLVDDGYVYIAQPPLFHVKRGKKTSYVKDERELDSLLVQRAVENRVVKTANGHELQGQELERHLEQLKTLQKHLQRVERRGLTRDIVLALLAAGVRDATAFSDQAKVDSLAATLRGESRDVTIQADEEHNAFTLVIADRSAGYIRQTFVGVDFVTAPDYRTLVGSYGAVKDLLGAVVIRSLDAKVDAAAEAEAAEADADAVEAPATGSIDDVLVRAQTPAPKAPAPKPAKDADVRIASMDELLDYFISAGRKGITIGRYKGLGEMNPEQLWMTTMDPSVRTLLQVKAEDHAEADLMFTTLMGDQVEPRRKFIEDNALDVKNLDI